MLRGTSRTLEQAAGANGDAVEQVQRADEFDSTTTRSDRALTEQSDANAAAVTVSDDGGAAIAAVLASVEGGDIGGGVRLPTDPLDPTWGKPSDLRRDRTLSETETTQALAADFDAFPARFLESATMTENTFDLPLKQQQLLVQQPDEVSMMVVAGGLLAFAVAGVVVNRVRRRIESKSKQKLKAFDEDDGDTSQVYALFS